MKPASVHSLLTLLCLVLPACATGPSPVPAPQADEDSKAWYLNIYADEGDDIDKDATAKTSSHPRVVLLDGPNGNQERRLFAVVVDRASSQQAEGDFYVSEPDTAISVDAAGPGWQITRGSAYARGWRPMIRTVRGTAISNASRLAVEVEGGQPGDAIHRFYHLYEVGGSNTDATVMLYKDDNGRFEIDPASAVSLPVGYYLEIRLDGNSKPEYIDRSPKQIADNDDRETFIKNLVNDKQTSKTLDAIIEAGRSE